MNGLFQSGTNLLGMSLARIAASREPADLVYQSVTVAAMLLLLGSMWLF